MDFQNYFFFHKGEEIINFFRKLLTRLVRFLKKIVFAGITGAAYGWTYFFYLSNYIISATPIVAKKKKKRAC